MARLLVQFFTEDITDFRWASIDEAEQAASIDWQDAGEDELAKVATQHPYPLILIIPQQCVYLTRVELPEKASRQLLSAIEYQIEDQLAQSIESQHFALGDTNDNPISMPLLLPATGKTTGILAAVDR